MRKLIFVVLLLATVLLLSWWARGSNFNLSTMMKNVFQPKSATPTTGSGQGQSTVTGKPTPTPISSQMLVSVMSSGFSPDTITVKPGTQVTWINKSGMIANITSNPKDPKNILNIGNFAQNVSVSVVLSTVGTYSYYDNKNPSHKATITVK